MATFNKLIADILSLRGTKKSLISQMRSNDKSLSDKKRELRVKVLDLNVTGGGGLPAGFLADGITTVKRNDLIFEIDYDQTENVILSIKIVKDDEGGTYYDISS